MQTTLHFSRLYLHDVAPCAGGVISRKDGQGHLENCFRLLHYLLVGLRLVGDLLNVHAMCNHGKHNGLWEARRGFFLEIEILLDSQDPRVMWVSRVKDPWLVLLQRLEALGAQVIGTFVYSLKFVC